MGEREHKDYRSLGEILHEARSSRGMSIAELSARTKISPRAIAALEADDLSQIAGPVYARSFTRNLAQALGLDAEFLLTKLALASPTAAVRQAPVEAKPAAPAATGPVKPSTAQAAPRDATVWRIENVRVTKLEPTRRGLDRRVWIALAVVGMVATAWLLLRAALPPDDSAREEMGELRSRLAEGGEPSPELDEASMLSPGPTGLKPPGDSTAVRATPASTQQQPNFREELAPTSPPSSESAPATGQSEARPPEERAAERGLTSIERPGSTALDQPQLQLLLRAERETEVWASPDGRQRRHRILRAGEEWTLQAVDHFSLEIEDPSAVAVILDGVRRQPPTGLSGEWILYPDPAPH